MKLIGITLVVLLAASAARADRPMPSKLREGWREARNNLLWWRPYDTFDGTNAAFELEHGLAPGGAIRYFGGELMKELAKPDGGDSNRVADALNRLVRGGTYDATNVLAEALFRDGNAFRYQTFLACVNAWPPDMSGLAEAVVSKTPAGRRAEWYVSLAKRGSPSSFFKHGGGISWREFIRIGTFMVDAGRSETDAACAAALDKAQLEAGPEWTGSNQRKRLALRFRDAGGEAGGHFSRLSRELGPPLPPTAKDIDVFVSRPGLDWPDDASVAGDPPEDLVSEWYRNAYRVALISFDMPKRDFIRMVADRFGAFVRENGPSPKNIDAWFNYVSALRYGADPVATNALLKAVDAEWMPESGAGMLDWAMLACDPNWETSEARPRFLERARQLHPPPNPIKVTPEEIAECNRRIEQDRIAFEKRKEEIERMMAQDRKKREQSAKRLYLLWWRPDDSSVSNNASREQKLGKPPGDTVKTFEKILGEKLFQPMWTRSAEVFTMQKRLVQSGTYDVTNALSRFLIHKKTDAFRFPLLVGCVGTWKADMSGLAETIVSRFPPETRAEWYSSLVQTNWDPYAEWRSPRMTVRKAVFLRAASLAETDAACAAAIDQALPAVDTEWGGSNLRKRLALRFRDAAGEPGEHFRRVATDCGPPQPPTPQDLDELAAHSRIDWPEDAAYIGAKPPESDAEGFRVALMLAAAEFGVPERDLTRMLAERLLGIVLNGKREEFGGTRWNRYIAALEYAGQSAEQPDDAAYFHAVLQKAGQPEKKGDAR